MVKHHISSEMIVIWKFEKDPAPLGFYNPARFIQYSGERMQNNWQKFLQLDILK